MDPESRTTIVNPTLVVEVTSDSTEDYNRTDKLESYQRIGTPPCVLTVDAIYDTAAA